MDGKLYIETKSGKAVARVWRLAEIGRLRFMGTVAVLQDVKSSSGWLHNNVNIPGTPKLYV